MPNSGLSRTLRAATVADAPVLFDLIYALAEYEQLTHEVSGSVDALAQHLMGDRPYIEAILAEDAQGPLGFALFFPIYSMAIAQAGFYLEDIFVLPPYRQQGLGKTLLAQLGQQATERGHGYLEWSVLDWNTPAITFYRRMGASILDDQRICRVSGDALAVLATHTSPVTTRIATHADLPDILQLLQINQILRCSPDDLEQSLLSHDSPYESLSLTLVVAEHQGAVIGVASISQNYSTFLTQPGALIESLAIAPDNLDRTIEQALIIGLAQVAQQRQYGRLEWRVSLGDQGAIAQAYDWGAIVLKDWRICQVRDMTTIRSATIL
jgi:GNAT superfamily N-acetyltransferase